MQSESNSDESRVPKDNRAVPILDIRSLASAREIGLESELASLILGRIRAAHMKISTTLGSTLFAVALSSNLWGQTAFTWQQIVQKFEATNPTMKATQLNIDESRAAEITAYLRPNPDFSLSADGFQVHSNNGTYRPLSGTVLVPGMSYLHERGNKRELRRDQAKES